MSVANAAVGPLDLAAVQAALPRWHVTHDPHTHVWRAADPGYQVNGIVIEAVDPDGHEILARVRAVVVALAHADGRGGRLAPDARVAADRGLVVLPDPMELRPSAPAQSREVARFQGYTGDACGECGSLQMVRNGTCQKCESCGATTGCS